MQVDRSTGRWIVRTDRGDVTDALQIAWARNEIKRRHNVKTLKYVAYRDDVLTHVFGVIAEMAVAEVVGGSYDRENWMFRPPHAPDCILPSGMICEIKYRDHPDWDFALPNGSLSSFEADVGILVVPAPDRNRDDIFDLSVEIKGCVSKKKFKAICERVDFGHGARLVARQEDLSPIDVLIAYQRSAS
jgi:hypothetical protein